jgi:GNAT superfamily N-acetyltransferase
MTSAAVQMAPVDARKSVTEINHIVKDPSYGFALMAIANGMLVGALGIIRVSWWYAEEDFLTDRFFFVTENFRHAGVGSALQAEAASVAQALGLKLIIHGKPRRIKDNLYLAPNTVFP